MHACPSYTQHIYTYKGERVCITQIRSRYSLAFFPVPLVSPYYCITTEQVKGTHLVVVRIGSTGPQERGLPKTYFHNDFPGSVGLDNASAHIAKAFRAILTLNFYLSERSILVKSDSSLSSLYTFPYLFPLLTTSGIHDLNNCYHTFRWSNSTGQ